MAKKSSSGHHKPTTAHGKGPARKQQTPERASTATLVRADGASGPSAANVVADSAPATKAQPAPKPQPARPAPAARPAVKAPVGKPAMTAATTPAAPAAPSAKVATTAATATASAPAASSAATATQTKPSAPRPATSAREQSARMARVRATQRARTEHLISAENYSYVVGDLKLVIGLASAAFIVLIALTFVLPH
ncbi:MAG: hypothetical protein KGO05_00510 [Chloroflexota bacterium]|nr:hypothetical protein [Chloroflexota bacterium]